MSGFHRVMRLAKLSAPFSLSGLNLLRISLIEKSPFIVSDSSSSIVFIDFISSMIAEPLQFAIGCKNPSQNFLAIGSIFSSAVSRKLTADARVSTAIGKADSIVHLPSGNKTLLNNPFSSCIAPPSGFVSLSTALNRPSKDSSSGFQFRSAAHSRIEPQISRNTVSRLFATFHTDWIIFVPLPPSFHASLIFFARLPKVPTIFCVISSSSSSVF